MKREAEEPIENLEKRVKQNKNDDENDENEGQDSNQSDDDGQIKQSSQQKHNGEKLAPKCRIALIVGYNGSDFCGSQKNNNVRTVEGEIEKSLFDIGCISKMNFGDLKKISWNRATRTDKTVHALQNCFSCKVHLSKDSRENDAGMELFRQKLNEALKKRTDEYQPTEEEMKSQGYQKNSRVLTKQGEIKVFCVIEVSNRFNAKLQTSDRDYSYYLPSFLLSGINEFYLGKLGTSLKPEEQTEPNKEDITSQRVVNGIIITKRLTNENDARDECNSFMKRDISHLLQNPEFLKRLYGYRLSDEKKQKVHDIFKNSFEGTQKYHNYTRDMKPDQNAAKRFMIELSANDYMYVNQQSFEVTSPEDPLALEFVHFFLKGQSFLYNQIRKMIGAIIQYFHGELYDSHFIENTFKDNGVQVALAPGDGLMLEKVNYDRYNQFNTTKKNEIMIKRVSQTTELQEYRQSIVSHIAARELKNKAYISWLSWFDDNIQDYYIKPPSIEQIKLIRGANWIDNSLKKIQNENENQQSLQNDEKENKNQIDEKKQGIFEIIPYDQELLSKKSDENKRSFGKMLEVNQPKLVALYYSMHTCPPCREFTPLLSSLYEELNEDKKVIEIIYFSGDKNDEQFDEYFAEMPWLAIPREQKSIMMQNAKRFEVRGVPRLIMLRAKDGFCLSKQCYEDVKKQGPIIIEQFLEEC